MEEVIAALWQGGMTTVVRKGDAGFATGPLARSSGEGDGEGHLCGAVVCCAAHSVFARIGTRWQGIQATISASYRRIWRLRCFHSFAVVATSSLTIQLPTAQIRT